MLRIALACLPLLAVGCKKKTEEIVGSTEAPSTQKATCDATKGPTTCVGDDVYQCSADNKVGERILSCDSGCRAGQCTRTCELRDAELIYVLDSESNLLRFDPRKLPNDPFETVGKLACPVTGPNSMAVDHNGVAWVNFARGLYRVSVIDGHCSANGLAPVGAPMAFGMAFVADDPKSGVEYLMVSDRDEQADGAILGRLDLSQQPPRFEAVAPIEIGTESGSDPELTGTGDGKLFAYVSRPGRGYVQGISRTTGKAEGPRWSIPGKADNVSAWAIAHYGGVFYVFATFDGNSMVYAVHRNDGKVELVKEDLPTRIVGAGVSTCAPLLEAPPP